MLGGEFTSDPRAAIEKCLKIKGSNGFP